MNNKIVVGVLAALVLLFGYAYVDYRETTPPVDQTVGRASGPSHYQAESFLQGLCVGTRDQTCFDNAGGLTREAVSGFVLSTSTAGTANTLTQSDLAVYSEIAVTPTVGSLTWTLPASSTMTTFLPNNGNSQEFAIVNASTTANITVTLSPGTGTLLALATSSAKIFANHAAQLVCTRLPSTDVSCQLLGN